MTAEEERARKRLAEIDGPDSLDGEDVVFDQFTVTVVQPMDYELTEDFLRRHWMRGAFRGITDGRDHTHGPIEITDFYLKDPPKVEVPKRWAMAAAFPKKTAEVAEFEPKAAIKAFELPDLQPASKVLSASSLHGATASRATSTLLPLLLGSFAGLTATLAAGLAVAAAVRRRGGGGGALAAAPYVAVSPSDFPPRSHSQEFGA